jgi:protein ImuA
MSLKTEILARLQKEVLSLQGFKPSLSNTPIDMGLGFIRHSFPYHQFPLGAMHEFCFTGNESAAATGGFVSGILSSLMKGGGAVLWIGNPRTIFSPAFLTFGIKPDRIIFIDLKKDLDVLWAMEEALKCDGLAAVVGEMSQLSFTASRRFQLAVEQSRVTGFILRRNPRQLNTTACVTRWKITSLPSASIDDMPGIGFPRWNVQLFKVRNGKPGSWQIEWRAGKFRFVPMVTRKVQQVQEKTRSHG